jgi:hypothetical protein
MNVCLDFSPTSTPALSTLITETSVILIKFICASFVMIAQ